MSSEVVEQIHQTVTWRHQVAEQRIRSTATRLQTIFDTALDGIILLDAAGCIESVNKSAARLFGTNEAEMKGRRFDTYLLSSEESRSFSRSYQQNAGLSLRGRRTNGSSFPLEISARLVLLEGQTCTACVVRDVTERHLIDNMKNEFISTISHELRTPITSIMGSMRLVQGGVTGDIPQRAQQLLEIAEKNCKRLLKIVNDMLDLSKIEQGQLQLQPKILSSEQIVHQSLEEIEGMALQGQVKLCARLEPNLYVKGDLDRLVQIMTNLLSNAIKHTPAQKELWVVTQRQQETVRFSVIDQGEGIAKEMQEVIFQRFQQADSSSRRLQSGTALGLAIARILVVQHHGQIGVFSNPGEGAAFWFELPHFTS